MGILDDDVVRVREATDLVELAQEHLALKRVGRRFQGLCPFHSEKTPSFSINPEQGFYYCFGCGAKGDAITFVREVEHLDFVTAVERLAARAGITLRYDDAAFSKERARRDRLHDAVRAAIGFYHDRLLTAPDAGRARQYVRSRGFERDAAVLFQLGFSPEGWDELARHLAQSKFARDDLVAAGLAFVNRAQKVQDVFRNRLMFPIWDQRGEPVGFGARTLAGDDGPKYKNSSETTLYQKSKLLYGLNLAKGEIVARGEVVICEGYTDVMAFHLAGVPNAVATCGTSLADDHFMTLKNLARRVTLAYDADAAGNAAAERCFQWEQRFEVQFQVADLPPGLDPGDLWRDDRERLAKAIEHAAPFLEFRLERAMAAGDVGTIEGRARVATAAAAIVAQHPNELVRDQYAMQLASRLGIDVDRLRDAITRARDPRTPPRARREVADVVPDDPADRPATPIDRLELDVLRWLLHQPELIRPYLDERLFRDVRARAVFRALIDAVDVHDALETADADTAARIMRLSVEEPEADEGDVEMAVTRAVVNLVSRSSERAMVSMSRRGFADDRDGPSPANPESEREDGDTVLALLKLSDSLRNARDAGQWDAALEIAAQLVGSLADTE